MNLIEKLIAEPSEETTSLLFEGDDQIFWVDWREDDSALTEYCESIIQTNKLSSVWEDDKLIIRYGDKSQVAPLTISGADRHITMVAINDILVPDYEIRMAWDSDGGDTLGFTILPTSEWSRLESQYGKDLVDKAFLQLKPRLNVFTDSLYGHRPE